MKICLKIHNKTYFFITKFTMKNTFIYGLLITTFCFALSINPATAQKKTKEQKAEEKRKQQEEKKAKKDAEKILNDDFKNFKKNPQAYLAFKEKSIKAEQEAQSIKGELARVKELEQQCATEEDRLKKEIEDLKAQLANKKPEKPDTGGGTGTRVVPAQGTHFVVQIGAFKDKDVATNENNPDFRNDKNVGDGFSRYIMGVFSDATGADELRKFLMQIDMRSNPKYRPIVAAYKDGKRVALEEVLSPEDAKKYK